VLDGAFSVLIGWVHVHDAADWEVDLSAPNCLRESLVKLLDTMATKKVYSCLLYTKSWLHMRASSLLFINLVPW
jgi:hypothetical protein